MTEGSKTSLFVLDMEKKIVLGDYLIGDKIPTLRELSVEYGLSRSVINAGIVELEKSGYIKSIPRKGTIVNDWKKEGGIIVLDGMMRNNTFNKEVLSSLLDARMLVETECARLAALNCEEEDKKDIKLIVDAEGQTEDIDKRIELDLAFHHSLAVASKNFTYPLLIKSFEVNVKNLIRTFYQNKEARKRALELHKEIYNNLRPGNSDVAKELMGKLLKHGETIIKDTITY